MRAEAGLFVVVGGVVGVGVGQQVAPRSVVPAGTPAAVAPTTTPAPVIANTPPVVTMADEAARAEFFAAGCTCDDAVELAQVWEVSTDEAEASGGQAVENGETLPISRCAEATDPPGASSSRA